MKTAFVVTRFLVGFPFFVMGYCLMWMAVFIAEGYEVANDSMG